MADAKTGKLLRLDLGAGQSPREGFEGVDIYPGSVHCHDLFKFPWPWKDDEVDELHCSHFVEHLPMEFVVHNGRRKDMFFAFFDECFRVLKPGGKMLVIVPACRNDRAFQDPTHRRFLNETSWFYLNAEWRGLNKLDHYCVDSDFGFNCVPIIPVEVSLLHPEAQARRMRESWNVVIDYHVTLESKKPAPEKKGKGK